VDGFTATRSRRIGVLTGYPTSPVRGVAQAALPQTCLPLASTPDVPFCAGPGGRRLSFWRDILCSVGSEPRATTL